MARVIPFKDHALAQLRERLGVVEEANQDLIAFARGHSGAVAAIHEAVIAAMEADSIDDLLHVVTQEWPLILGIDAVNGVHRVEPLLLMRSIEQVYGVAMRTVAHGHPLFGPACDLIRAEAVIRIECGSTLPIGLIALGQRSESNLDARHGSELLLFLGRSLAAIIRRWLVNSEN
jgi:uncharacterized protein YigA (DUF484 family)